MDNQDNINCVCFTTLHISFVLILKVEKGERQRCCGNVSQMEPGGAEFSQMELDGAKKDFIIIGERAVSGRQPEPGSAKWSQMELDGAN